VSPEQIDAAARKLAWLLGQPWDDLTEEQRDFLRKHARMVLDAAEQHR
jgi:hypothetical protein